MGPLKLGIVLLHLILPYFTRLHHLYLYVCIGWHAKLTSQVTHKFFRTAHTLFFLPSYALWSLKMLWPSHLSSCHHMLTLPITLCPFHPHQMVCTFSVASPCISASQIVYNVYQDHSVNIQKIIYIYWGCEIMLFEQVQSLGLILGMIIKP